MRAMAARMRAVDPMVAALRPGSPTTMNCTLMAQPAAATPPGARFTSTLARRRCVAAAMPVAAFNSTCDDWNIPGTMGSMSRPGNVETFTCSRAGISRTGCSCRVFQVRRSTRVRALGSVIVEAAA